MTFGWWSAGFSGGVAVLCARSRGEPSSAHCEQRLSERLTPCPCDPVCACTGIRGYAFLFPHPHAAQRAVTGWRGGLGRVGADLASAGSMRPPPSPERHVSTVRLATKHASRETARHHTSQARNATPPHKPAQSMQPQNTCLLKMGIPGISRFHPQRRAHNAIQRHA